MHICQHIYRMVFGITNHIYILLLQSYNGNSKHLYRSFKFQISTSIWKIYIHNIFISPKERTALVLRVAWATHEMTHSAHTPGEWHHIIRRGANIHIYIYVYCIYLYSRLGYVHCIGRMADIYENAPCHALSAQHIPIKARTFPQGIIWMTESFSPKSTPECILILYAYDSVVYINI